MANRKTLFGIVSVGIGLLALAYFNENAASFFEETGLNRNWTLIAPALRFLASGIRFLADPIMTHLYAFFAGVGFCWVVGWVVAKANAQKPNNDRLISLPELVNYLSKESAWAYAKGKISDQDMRLMLIDAFAHGYVRTFARPRSDGSLNGVSYVEEREEDENPSPLTRINPDYFGAAVINLDAIRTGSRRQIGLKPGHFGDEFDHWQVLLSEVHKLWPPAPRSKSKGKSGNA